MLPCSIALGRSGFDGGVASVKVPKIHLSRKLVLIVGGVLVLCGGTGGAAVYIGADTLLGPSYAELNGLKCTEVQTVEIHKKDRFWIRKYVTTTEPGDGLSRVKTALRVAKLVQEAKKADLVQVVVLDVNGPKERGHMRGRAVGADVIYVPDPTRVPEANPARVLTARYADGLAAANGQYFGERVDMIEGDVQALLAKLDDSTDCVTPEVVLPEGAEGGHGGAKADAHGKKAEGHGDAGGHGEAPADGHGEAPAEGHGEAPADGHGEAPASEHGAETPVAEHGGGESKGWMASLMGMVGLGGDEAPADAHGAADAGHGDAQTEGHGEAPAEGHGEPAAAGHGEGHAAPAEDSAALPEGDHSTEGAAHGDAGAEHASAPADGGHEAPAHDASAPAEDPAEDSSAHGGAAAAPTEDGHADAAGHAGSTEADQASAPASHEAEVPVEEVPVETPPAHDGAASEAPANEAVSAEAPAEGGGWFSSLKSMVGLGGEEAAASGEGDAAPAETPTAPASSGEDHGAAWLEKMRSQPIEPAGDAASPTTAPEEHGAAADHAPAASEADAGHAVEGATPPAEDETKLPPKKVIPAEEAKAGH